MTPTNDPLDVVNRPEADAEDRENKQGKAETPEKEDQVIRDWAERPEERQTFELGWRRHAISS